MDHRKKHIKAGIIGAASLSAGKLLEILVQHPVVEVVTCVSETSPGAPIARCHPQLRGALDLVFDEYDANKLAQCDVVFSCKRPTETFSFIEGLLASGPRFIDLSADYRLKSSDVFQRWYGVKHDHAHLLNDAVYGLPEWHRNGIRNAVLVANPGCYTTASILACAPLLSSGLAAATPIIIDAISGVSGAGRGSKPENQFISVSENVRAYRIGSHQHTPEIEQEVEAIVSGAAQPGFSNQNEAHPPLKHLESRVRVLFVPHVGPYKVGIMANCYLRLAGKTHRITDRELYDIIHTAYAREPFVRVYEPGELPQIEYVTGTNYCDIAATYDPRTETIVVISVIDNLIKGAAGQAVQNMNIMFGVDETTGLL
ncbi:MAG: N-acetyl-gamma-glutamyl-phosphate reductase [Candidatus Sumerlaeota bacterium]|nr:N-acetyl-gamma-glutamyl-phosphate reductase [Candidatus Sumerlaeota bacterium]